MRRFSYTTSTALLAIAGLALVAQTACKTPDDKDVKASIEIVDVDTSWTMKEYRQWPNPKLTLVPTVTFKIKNLTSETLKYININAIFKEPNATENLGDHFKAVIRGEGIAPGQTSPAITLKSNFGVAGINVESFKINPQWRIYEVRLFAQMGGSRHVPMGEWKVSRRIDFQEDKAPVQDKKPVEAPKAEPIKK